DDDESLRALRRAVELGVNWVVERTEESLQRLGVQPIDVQQFHVWSDEGDFRNEYFKGDRKREVWERVLAIAADGGSAVDEVAALALRFCIAHPAVSTAIAGMRSVWNVERNIAAVEQGPLADARLESLHAHRWVRDFYPR
ncbi:MAG TPA: aldo/keto reductase, partial [Gaiellaceae bacterium]